MLKKASFFKTRQDTINPNKDKGFAFVKEVELLTILESF